MTFIKYSDSTSILSDILPIAGAGTVMNRREELLDVGLISDKKIKKGRRYYIVYELTPKGERVLEQLETTLEILEE
ncbi:MAG: archaellum operon transcriptional activator EarA family protein [Euryarchaeota archaeon]|nr:archaellum operon transcriptional activator EarA family protein [Euryarchaeota archaeon]